jgi:hypothetical protein
VGRGGGVEVDVQREVTFWTAKSSTWKAPNWVELCEVEATPTRYGAPIAIVWFAPTWVQGPVLFAE